MATLVSYDLNGKKLSFANWISNLSPTDTPFVSMTGKESIAQTLFQWQTDSLAAVVDNAVVEGSTAVDGALGSTETLNNYTQILRKVLKVSDTANATANYGRGRELQYQMEKAGKEIKRDLEKILLSAQAKDAGDASTKPRLTGGFESLVAALDAPDEDTGAVVHKGIEGAEIAESDIWGLTYNLYLSGSHADIIMFHPKHASFFSSLMEVGVGERVKMFDGADTKLNTYVTEVIDPLGQRYCLCPNRWMPEEAIYFFRSKDWTQMILRAPERTKLAKDGSYEKWMIEMEIGLRHANPFASGILKLSGGTPPGDKLSIDKSTATIGVNGSGSGILIDPTKASVVITASAADTATVSATSDKPAVATVAPVAAKGRAAKAAKSTKFEVKAVGAGTAKVSFTDGTDTIEATITVVASELDVASLDDMFPGDTGQKAVASGAAGTYTWSVEFPEAASITADGTLTAKSPAKNTDVIATEVISGISFKGRAYLTVDDVEVTVAPATASIEVDGTQAFTATAKPTRAQAAGFTWTSGTPATATIDTAGTATGVAEGTSTISAESKAQAGKAGTAELTVTPKSEPNKPTSVYISETASGSPSITEVSVELGKVHTLSVHVLPTTAPQGWKISDAGDSAIAAIQTSGNFLEIDTMQSGSVGETSCTVASTTDDSITATLKVTVTPASA